MPSKAKRVVTADEFEWASAEALEVCYQVAKAAYGPNSGVVWLEQTYGDPIASHDGVTNLDELYLEDPLQNMIARGVIQASRRSNTEVGDGTTAVVILAYYLYREARKLVVGGFSVREVVATLQQLANDVQEYVDSVKQPATPQVLAAVAKVSCGDKALGELIADTLEQVGPLSGITVDDFAGDSIYPELVEGFYWPRGYASVQLINDPAKLEARYENVAILITEKRLATSSDIAPILDKIVGKKISDLVIVGDVDQEALAVLAALRLQGLLTATPVDVPTYAGNRSLMLSDLALVTGGQVLLPGVSSKDFELAMLGTASKVVITGMSTSIIGREGDKDAIANRMADLEEQYATSTATIDKEQIQARLGRLRGKMAILHVGGASEVEQQEAKLRVQDAICAVQAAARDGVVAGGGITLAFAAAGRFTKALQSPFKTLATNAGHNPELLLSKLKPNNLTKGYDFTDNSLEPIDLMEAGIIDPAAVTKETIKNAVSVICKVLQGSAALTLVDRSTKRD